MTTFVSHVRAGLHSVDVAAARLGCCREMFREHPLARRLSELSDAGRRSAGGSV